MREGVVWIVLLLSLLSLLLPLGETAWYRLNLIQRAVRPKTTNLRQQPTATGRLSVTVLTKTYPNKSFNFLAVEMSLESMAHFTSLPLPRRRKKGAGRPGPPNNFRGGPTYPLPPPPPPPRKKKIHPHFLQFL